MRKKNKGEYKDKRKGMLDKVKAIKKKLTLTGGRSQVKKKRK